MSWFLSSTPLQHSPADRFARASRPVRGSFVGGASVKELMHKDKANKSLFTPRTSAAGRATTTRGEPPPRGMGRTPVGGEGDAKGDSRCWFLDESFPESLLKEFVLETWGNCALMMGFKQLICCCNPLHMFLPCGQSFVLKWTRLQLRLLNPQSTKTDSGSAVRMV